MNTQKRAGRGLGESRKESLTSAAQETEPTVTGWVKGGGETHEASRTGD